jgi:hypothetical protein
MKTNLIYLFLIATLGLLLFLNYDNKVSDEKISRNTRKDTVYQITADTVYIQKKADIKYLSDTVYMTKPFIASIDTNDGGRILRAEFSFPENRFTVYHRSIDTNKITIENTTQDQLCAPLAIAAGGTAAGLILALIFQ